MTSLQSWEPMASSPKPLVLSLMHDSVLLAFTLLAPTFIESQRAMADDVNEQRLQARVQPVVIIVCHGRSSSLDLRRNIPRIPQVPNDPTVVRDPLTQRVISSILFSPFSWSRLFEDRKQSIGSRHRRRGERMEHWRCVCGE